MLAKKNRLPVQSALGLTGRIVRRPAFTLKIFPAAMPYPRFGVVVGKRVGATAVLRNKIRRRAYTAIGSRQGTWPVADYLVIVHPAAAIYTAKQWHDELVQYSLTGSAS